MSDEPPGGERSANRPRRLGCSLIPTWIFVILAVVIFTGAYFVPRAFLRGPRYIDLADVAGAEDLVEELTSYHATYGRFPETSQIEEQVRRKNASLHYNKEGESYCLYYYREGMRYKLRPGMKEFVRSGGF